MVVGDKTTRIDSLTHDLKTQEARNLKDVKVTTAAIILVDHKTDDEQEAEQPEQPKIQRQDSTERTVVITKEEDEDYSERFRYQTAWTM